MSSRDSDSDSADDLSSEDEGIKIRNPGGKPAVPTKKPSEDEDEDLDTVATPSSGSEPKAKPAANAKPAAVQPAAAAKVQTPEAPAAPVTPPVAPTPPPAARESPVVKPVVKPPPSPPKPSFVAKKPASPSPPKPKPKPQPKKQKEAPKQALQKSSSTNQPQVGRYASSTESMKARVQATQREKLEHPSPEKRKGRSKPKTDAKFVLGRRVDEICQHESAAFASSTPRDIFAEVIHPEIPAPGIYTRDRPAPTALMFPNSKEKSRDHPTGFGSTCPRDSIFTLTNGSITYRKFEKEFFAAPEPAKPAAQAARRQSAPPIQTSVCGTPLVRAAPKEKTPLEKQKTYERIALYSSFDASARDKSAAWAKSKTPRLAIDTSLAVEQKATKEKQKAPSSPKPEIQPKLSDVLDKARKEVEKRASKRDPSGPAFGTKSPRECLTIMATCTPPPGQYEIP
eukprot:TRINITY_DN2117_c0_g1_i1.p1 TRINITY_DN2117_c0_g1~~TRINITY_DN2117_c0_g1_i1.p1  ORF type:complete len:454 (+),score=61.89 TRINITY_DN2117_c0_g1_i1:33-1394(+)